jgi:hypothetical protein
MKLTVPTAVSIILMAPIGFGLGVLYFAALRRTAALLAVRRAIRPAVAFTAARGLAAIGVFGFAAWLGAGPLLSAFAGFLLARWSALRQVRGTR